MRWGSMGLTFHTIISFPYEVIVECWHNCILVWSFCTYMCLPACLPAWCEPSSNIHLFMEDARVTHLNSTHNWTMTIEHKQYCSCASSWQKTTFDLLVIGSLWVIDLCKYMYLLELSLTHRAWTPSQNYQFTLHHVINAVAMGLFPRLLLLPHMYMYMWARYTVANTDTCAVGNCLWSHAHINFAMWWSSWLIEEVNDQWRKWHSFDKLHHISIMIRLGHTTGKHD